MSSKRRFELVEGTSTKFWEIWREEEVAHTRYGRIGGFAETKSRRPSKKVATIEQLLATMILEKTAKGYRETTGADEAAPLPELDRAQLAQHLGNLPGLVDDGAFLVLADWLQSQGHPWGELIALHHAMASAPEAQRAVLAESEAALLAARGPALVGAASRHSCSQFAWHLGFLRTATLGTAATAEAMSAAVDELLALPAAHLLEGLILNPLPAALATQRDWGDSGDSIVDPWTDLAGLAARIPPRISHLGFGAPGRAATAYVQMPSFDQIGALFPALRKLEITGSHGDRLGALVLPELVDLEVRFAAATAEGLAAITASTLPKLERLSVWLGGGSSCVLDSVYSPYEYNDDREDHGEDGLYPSHYTAADLDEIETHDVESEITAVELAHFLSMPFPERLTHLALRSAVLDAQTCEVIARSPVIGRLRSLDLSGGTLDERSVSALIATGDMLVRLEQIDVSNNRLTAKAAKELTKAMPNVRIGTQRRPATPPAFFMRYVATME
ncbi:MAG: WGR domain-containing protein [Kofleriaceae bacterium]